ncbi:MAG TPA: tetratricopeptide repeat protein [Bacteroidales bacterium]|nr:tetratricopeptide repeat protein [Bacteroidales bacterium]
MIKHEKRTILAILFFAGIMLTGCMPREYRANELLKRGTEKVAQQQHVEAIRIFSQAIRLQPDFAQAYTFRGSAKFDIGDFAGAMEDYTRAIELNPTYAEPYDFRGRIHMRMRNIEAACRDFRKAEALGRPGMSDRTRHCP